MTAHRHAPAHEAPPVINRAGNGVPVRPPIWTDGDENVQIKPEDPWPRKILPRTK